MPCCPGLPFEILQDCHSSQANPPSYTADSLWKEPGCVLGFVHKRLLHTHNCHSENSRTEWVSKWVWLCFSKIQLTFSQWRDFNHPQCPGWLGPYLTERLPPLPMPCSVLHRQTILPIPIKPPVTLLLAPPLPHWLLCILGDSAHAPVGNLVTSIKPWNTRSVWSTGNSTSSWNSSPRVQSS